MLPKISSSITPSPRNPKSKKKNLQKRKRNYLMKKKAKKIFLTT